MNKKNNADHNGIEGIFVKYFDAQKDCEIDPLIRGINVYIK